MSKEKKHPLLVPGVLLLGLLSFYGGKKIYDNEVKPQKKETSPTNIINKGLENWIETYKDSSFNLDNKNYYWDRFGFYDSNNDGKDDGLFIVFRDLNRKVGSPWTGAVGYFEFEKGGGKINPNAKKVYPFKRWDSRDYGNGLEDTNLDGKLDKIMNSNETQEFSNQVHYKPKRNGKII